jgi:hypothetical protein
MGVAGVEGAYLAVPDLEVSAQTQYLGPIFDAEISVATELKSSQEAAILVVLRQFFVKLWDAANGDRAATLTDAFVEGHQLPPR